MGEGRNALYLAMRGFSVVGVDVSTIAAARCASKARARKVGLRVAVADLEHWLFAPKSFDWITQFYFLERALFPSITRTLRPGGHFILETFSSRHAEVSSFGPRNPDFLLDAQEARDLTRDLDLIHFEDETVELDEGRHQGPAGLIRLIARSPD